MPSGIGSLVGWEKPICRSRYCPAQLHDNRRQSFPVLFQNLQLFLSTILLIRNDKDHENGHLPHISWSQCNNERIIFFSNCYSQGMSFWCNDPLGPLTVIFICSYLNLYTFGRGMGSLPLRDIVFLLNAVTKPNIKVRHQFLSL